MKRKWERIVHRRFERSNGINESSLPANTAAHLQGGVVLEGIREGVQGVSRFIAAGLGELAHSQPPLSTSTPATKTTALRRSHSAQPSSSSVSTCATNFSNGTRLSQSSASSLGEDPTHPEEECERESVDGETEQILMVRDTGATPTMSPNPAFVQKHNSGPIEVGSGTRDSVSLVGAKHRRKSRDINTLSTSTSFSNGISQPCDLSTSPTAELTIVKKTLKAKRMGGTGLPPPVSIPGLGSLTSAVGSECVEPLSSWMGNMGKKWEEIQKGSTCVTFLINFPHESQLTAIVQIYEGSKKGLCVIRQLVAEHRIGTRNAAPGVRVIQSTCRVPYPHDVKFYSVSIDHFSPIIFLCVIIRR